MKPVLDEVRRAFRLTFVDGPRWARKGTVGQPGHTTDPHLARGFIAGLLVVALSLAASGVCMLLTRSYLPFFTVYLPGCIVANVVWFVVAARSRAKG